MQDKLYHHGIRGMHWGERRFQNSDGTLTSAGKKRYSGNGKIAGRAKSVKDMSDAELDNAIKRMNKERQYNTMLAERNNKSDKLAKTQKVINSSNDAVNSIKQIRNQNTKMDLSKMSDKELRDRVNRELLERQYTSLFKEPAKVRKGEDYVNTVLNVTGKALSVASTAVSLAVAIKKMQSS